MKHNKIIINGNSLKIEDVVASVRNLFSQVILSPGVSGKVKKSTDWVKKF